MTSRARRCPLCGAETAWEGNSHRPFCSGRCKLIDLGKWLGEQYRIPSEPLDDESQDSTSEPDKDE